MIILIIHFQGTDITEAFECHHLSTSVNKVLEKYYVRDAKTPRNSPFTFEEDGFYRTLKKVIVEELKNVPKEVYKKSDRIMDGIFATYLLSSAFACYTKNPVLVNLSYFIASVTLAWTVVASHNYIHRKSNWRMHLFSMAMWSYRLVKVTIFTLTSSVFCIVYRCEKIGIYGFVFFVPS